MSTRMKWFIVFILSLTLVGCNHPKQAGRIINLSSKHRTIRVMRMRVKHRTIKKVLIQHRPIKKVLIQHRPIRRLPMQRRPIRRSPMQHRPIKRLPKSHKTIKSAARSLLAQRKRLAAPELFLKSQMFLPIQKKSPIK